MAITSTVPSAASIGAYSAEVTAAHLAAGDPDPAIAVALRTFATTAVADLTAIDDNVTALLGANASKDWKDSVLLASDATIANLSSVTVADFDGTGQGITLTAGKRVLVRNNASPDGVIATHGKYQGLYVTGVVALGSAALTRATDADSSDEVTSGLTVTVTAGTYAAKDFQLTTADPITLGTTALTFSVVGLGVIPAPTAATKLLYDNGATYLETAAGTAGQVPVVNAGATAPVYVSVSGDSTLSSAGAMVNTKVNGAAVSAAGALTTGNVPTVTGVSTLTYQAVNLAGGANYVTGLLPTANLAPGTNAQIAVTNAGATAKVDVSVSGDATLASTGALTVTKVNGSLFQSGVATLVAGHTAAIAATVTANTRIVAFLKTPNTTTATAKYAALDTDRVIGAPGSFKVTAIIAAGDTINVADVSTVDWIAFG